MSQLNGDLKGYGLRSADAFKVNIPKGRELLGGDLLAQCLKTAGVEVAFGIHGGHLDAFLYGCSEAGIQLIDVRNEAAAINAAEAYAKVKKTIGVCFATANSGFGNALPGLSTAAADRSPIFCVTSSPPLRDAESNCLQGFHDQVVVAKTICKFAYRCTAAEEIPRLVAYAIRQATSGAKGPTLIDFPIDVLFSPVDISRVAWGSITKTLPFPPAPNPQAIQETLSLLKSAKRPLLIVGTGASDPKMSGDLTKMIDTLQIPTFYSLKSTSALPIDHPLQGGCAWNLGALKEKPDLIILLGARTGMFLGNRSGGVLPPSGTKYVQIDVDGGEIGKSQAIDLGIVSEAHEFVKALNEAIGQASVAADKQWVDVAMAIRKQPHHHANDPEIDPNNGRPHPLKAMTALFESIQPGAIVLLDGGDAMLWGGDCMELCKPSLCMFTSGYLGMLGNGFGYAIGCAVADPSRQVVQIQGDGSAGFHLAELDTYARFNLNILTVICNNSIWGMSQGGQEVLYGKHTDARPAADKLNPDTKFHLLAEAFGCKGIKTTDVASIPKAVKSLSGSPSLLNMMVSNKPIAPGTLAMVDYTDDPAWICVPYYDNVPRPHYQQAKNGSA